MTFLKTTLWAFVVIGIFALLINSSSDSVHLVNELYPVVTVFASICTLAICESIEKIGGKKR